MEENKEIVFEETKPLDKANENVMFETGKKTGWGKRSVTRRFLIAALAITVITNAAVSAGALALISKSGREAKPDKIVTEDQKSGQSDNSAGDQFGNGLGDQYLDSFGDQYGGQYNDNYSNPFGDQYGDSYSNPYSGDYGSQYNNGYGDLYNGYDDQYLNGFGDQYNDSYGDQYLNGFGDQNSNDSGSQYGNDYGNQNNSGNQSSSATIGIVISENSGVYVSQVTGSNAKKAGFAEGDKIISIDGKNISSSSDLISEVQSHKAGDTVSVVVERNGQSIELKTVLE